MYLVDDTEGTPEDTVVLELKVRCKKNPKATKDTTDPDVLYQNHKGILKYEIYCLWLQESK